MPNRQILIFTNCTSRKRGAEVAGELRAQSLPRATYKVVSTEWAGRVASAARAYKAQEMYCGRAVVETLRAARTLQAEVAFLSAGLGVVHQAELIPAYDLTSSPRGANSIAERVTEPYRPARWWRALMTAHKGKRSITRFIRDREPDLILCAVPASYLQMVGEEIESLPTAVRRKVRILGPRRITEVPVSLRSHWLPYDERLDSPDSGVNGTTADFPHRALRHFACGVLADMPRASISEHRELVESALRHLTPYVRTRGVSVSDGKVLDVIGSLWAKCGGQRNRILRELRAHSGIACEQSRFKRLADRYEGIL
jgi:hypothetical protein